MRVLLIAYDNGSHLPIFPQNLAYLTAALKEVHGVNVTIWQQDIHHYPDAALTTHLDSNFYDVLGLGFVAGYYQYKKAVSLARCINRARMRPRIFVLGGHGPAAAPDYFLRRLQADVCVIGDGEDVIRRVLRGDFARDGVLYGNQNQDIDSIPFPAYDHFPVEVYRLHWFPTTGRTDFTMQVLSGRGCPYKCTFCFRMDSNFRPRSAEAIVEEIRYLQRRWGITHIQFSDELLMSSKARTVEVSEALMPLKIKWDCNGRLNHATPEVLKVMKRSGCEYINYGCEALDDKVLKNIKKGLTVAQIHRGVENTAKVGIEMGLNFMWGNHGDNLSTLQRAVGFLKNWSGMAELRTIRPVTPYPGSTLYERAVADGLLHGIEDFYERKHTNSDLFSVNCMENISIGEAHDALMDANLQLIENHYNLRLQVACNDAMDFYQCEMLPDQFRGFRAI